MTDRTSPIGVFDSGVGGLTVVKEIINNLPNENIVYFGDTARVPYGNKSAHTVIRYSSQIIRFLSTKDVKAIVIACNTASALALGELEKNTDLPIMGVTIPGAKTSVRVTRNNKIGVIATDSTVSSGLYQKLIRAEKPEAEVFAKACPLFVPLVEEGWVNDEITLMVAKRYLDDLKSEGIDTLILGCTHYPLLQNLIGGYLGDEITLVNPAYETVRALKDLLEKNDLQNNTGKTSFKKFYASDSTNRFVKLARLILPCEIKDAQKVMIEDY